MTGLQVAEAPGNLEAGWKQLAEETSRISLLHGREVKIVYLTDQGWIKMKSCAKWQAYVFAGTVFVGAVYVVGAAAVIRFLAHENCIDMTDPIAADEEEARILQNMMAVHLKVALPWVLFAGASILEVAVSYLTLCKGLRPRFFFSEQSKKQR